MSVPTKDSILAAISVAITQAIGELEHIFATIPDAKPAADAALAYLTKQFAPEVISKIVDGLPAEVVAAFATGRSEVRKSLSDLG